MSLRTCCRTQRTSEGCFTCCRFFTGGLSWPPCTVFKCGRSYGRQLGATRNFWRRAWRAAQYVQYSNCSRLVKETAPCSLRSPSRINLLIKTPLLKPCRELHRQLHLLHPPVPTTTLPSNTRTLLLGTFAPQPRLSSLAVCLSSRDVFCLTIALTITCHVLAFL